MRKLSILLAVFLLAPVSAKEVKMVEYDWKVTKIVDGDTVKFEAPWVPDPIKKEMSIRVYGVDLRNQRRSRSERARFALNTLALSLFI